MKNIIFDNGGVIVKYSASTYLDCFNYDDEKKKKLLTLFNTEKYIEYSKGLISEKDFQNYCLNLFPEYKNEVLQILDFDSFKILLPIYSKTIDFIKKLKSLGFNTYLLSDIYEPLIRYMNEAVDGFESLFNGIMYSCRVHKVKKDGDVFDDILKQFDLNPQETLFIDDSDINLKEAEKRNINTYKFLDPEIDILKIEKLLNL